MKHIKEILQDENYLANIKNRVNKYDLDQKRRYAEDINTPPVENFIS